MKSKQAKAIKRIMTIAYLVGLITGLAIASIFFLANELGKEDIELTKQSAFINGTLYNEFLTGYSLNTCTQTVQLRYIDENGQVQGVNAIATKCLQSQG